MKVLLVLRRATGAVSGFITEGHDTEESGVLCAGVLGATSGVGGCSLIKGDRRLPKKRKSER